MRLFVCLVLLFAAIIPVNSQSLTVLLLPSPSPPVSVEAQNNLLNSLPVVWQKVLGKLMVSTFHKDSPSIQRALREGKISPEVLANPYDHANELSAVEGAKAAFWVRVKKAENSKTQGIEAKMLVPKDLNFECDLEESPPTEEERKLLRPLYVKTSPPPELVIALRLGQWLYEQLKPIIDTEPVEQKISSDQKEAKALIVEGKWDEAIGLLSQMVSESPQDPNLYLLLGQAYEGRQSWEDALLEYRRAVYLQSDLWEAWKGIARMATRQKRWELALTAIRQLRKASEIEPNYLDIGARAATVLASEAQRRGRTKEAETFVKEASELDSILIQSTSDFYLILEAAERLQRNREFKLAIEALTKLVSQNPPDQIAAERVLKLAWVLRRSELTFPLLVTLASGKDKIAFSRDVFRIAASVLDTEIVKFFEQVRDSLSAFDAKKLARDDLLNLLKQIKSSAEQLLRIAYKIQATEPFVKTHNRRLLCYELFLQATELLTQWVEQTEDLIRRRAVVLYEFARNELEQAWKEERVLR
ncbi:MAG: tetratricopeptide repeat protein [Armatimonadetes bacterium]|nr:tetratricopeptide repeat protein [Armatimonadota bacterium]MDW8026768.1 tetratricopeptide repeat protein [Armatimonadota bacterium]